MTSRRSLVLPLALVSALVLSACTDGGDVSGPTDRSPTATPSVRPTIAAPVPGGFVSATFDVTGDVKIDALIARLNAIPGVLGAGYFAGEKRVLVRLKPDATKAEVEAAVALVRSEASLSDVVFESPEATGSPSPASPSGTAKPPASAKPSPTTSSY